MCFLYSAQVVAAIVRSVPRASAGLSRFAASPVPAAPPAPIKRVRLVHEQDDGLGRGLHFVDHLAEPVLELPLHAGAGLQQADVEREQRDVLQRRRHVAPRQADGKAFDDRRLADAGLAGQDRVVLAPAHQDVDDLADLLVAAADGIDLAFARPLGEVGGVALERLLLARAAPAPSRRWPRRAPAACRPDPSVAASASSGDPLTMRANSSVSRSSLMRSNCREMPVSALRSDGRLQNPDDQVAGPHARVAEHQRGVDPARAPRRSRHARTGPKWTWRRAAADPATR